MNKQDILMFLDSQRKTVINWDGLDYIVYPIHIIDAILKDYKK